MKLILHGSDKKKVLSPFMAQTTDTMCVKKVGVGTGKYFE
jgi:hypothetical protein